MESLGPQTPESKRETLIESLVEKTTLLEGVEQRHISAEKLLHALQDGSLSRAQIYETLFNSPDYSDNAYEIQIRNATEHLEQCQDASKHTDEERQAAEAILAALTATRDDATYVQLPDNTPFRIYATNREVLAEAFMQWAKASNMHIDSRTVGRVALTEEQTREKLSTAHAKRTYDDPTSLYFDGIRPTLVHNAQMFDWICQTDDGRYFLDMTFSMHTRNINNKAGLIIDLVSALTIASQMKHRGLAVELKPMWEPLIRDDKKIEYIVT